MAKKSYEIFVENVDLKEGIVYAAVNLNGAPWFEITAYIKGNDVTYDIEQDVQDHDPKFKDFVVPESIITMIRDAYKGMMAGTVPLPPNS